ncbi:unnamed protein product, partial [Urochloa humidicola]
PLLLLHIRHHSLVRRRPGRHGARQALGPGEAGWCSSASARWWSQRRPLWQMAQTGSGRHGVGKEGVRPALADLGGDEVILLLLALTVLSLLALYTSSLSAALNPIQMRDFAGEIRNWGHGIKADKLNALPLETMSSLNLSASSSRGN